MYLLATKPNGWLLKPHRRTRALADSYDAWYSPSPPGLERYVGPVKVVSLEGKGRGLVTTSDMERGDVILIVPPLVFREGLDGQRPEPELLIDDILERRLHERSPWLRDRLLFDGSVISLKSLPDITSPLPLDETPRQPPANDSSLNKNRVMSVKKTSASAAGFGAKVRATVRGTSDPSDSLPGGVDRMTARRVAKATSLNCFGDSHSDKALNDCRDQPVTSHVGLWPEMCYINHSCAPNSINYVIGDVMVIRAAQDLKGGQEVTISYLGRPQLDHVQSRIDKLEEDYGFRCECERCTMELIHSEKLGGLDSFYDEVAEELLPLFRKAKEDEDVAAIEVITRRLRVLMNLLYTSMQKALLGPQVP